jgi:serine phosphatase RsbU (regulator of sigma subunit)
LAVAITKPISGLSNGMTKFVGSQFSDNEDFPVKTTTLEIAELVQNYSILKREIVDLIENFKQKVEERTREIEIQSELLRTQKEETEQINKNIITGLTYAKHIQHSLMPSPTYIKELFPESFIYFKPKDIVSGDFYWAKKFTTVDGQELHVVAVADATGHGVSGALMSMLGITFLNDITPRNEIKHASEVLSTLRDSILQALNNKENGNQSNNGIDIGLFVINTQTLQLEFSGANRYIWIIRNKELVELKGDKLPIGGQTYDKFYNDYTYDLKKGDSVYLFTDGYADQFGEKSGRKFMKNKLSSLMTDISSLSTEEQYHMIEENHLKWKGNVDQTDDILVVGINI